MTWEFVTALLPKVYTVKLSECKNYQYKFNVCITRTYFLHRSVNN